MARKLINEMTPEEKREFTSKGGKASVEVRKKKRALAEQFEAAMDNLKFYSVNQINKKLKDPKLRADVREKLLSEREILLESNPAVSKLLRILSSTKVSAGVQLGAASTILEHTYGKPKQRTELELNKDLPPPIFNITFVDGNDKSGS